MISNETIVNELKKGTQYGCLMLVRKFYEPGRKAIAAYFGIQYCDTGSVVNQAMRKIIVKIDTIEFKSEKEFSAYVNKVIFNTALDYLRQKQKEKEFLQNQGVQFVPILPESSYVNISDNDEEKIENDLDIFAEIEVNDKTKEPFNETEFDEEEQIDPGISEIKAEFEFFCDTDTLELAEKSKFIDNLFKSFSLDGGCYLRLYLNGSTHEEIAKVRNSNAQATRKYI